MKILSLDSATHKTGWATFENVNGCWIVDSGLFRAKASSNATTRMEDIFKQIKEKAEEFKPDYIIFEDSPGVSIKITRMLSRLHGCIIALAIINDTGLYEYLPSQWRSIMGFKGSTKREAQKINAIEYVNAKYGTHHEYDPSDRSGSDDICEAICIGEAFIKERKLNAKN